MTPYPGGGAGVGKHACTERCGKPLDKPLVRYRAAMGLRTRLFGPPRGFDACARRIDGGNEADAVVAVRRLPDEPRAIALLTRLLTDPRVAVRRVAAVALSGRAAAPVAALRSAYDVERTDNGRLRLAIALARAGEASAPLADSLAAHAGRRFATHGGSRSPLAASGVAPLVERFWRALGGTVEALRAERRGERDLLGVAELRHPDDVAWLRAQASGAGRRGSHTLLLALARTGDPDVARELLAALRARDVDPGHGFAQRRIAAEGLGELGLRSSVPAILAAVTDEVHDFEGRPGAGLGIQFPVRTALYYALGEIADARAVPTLIAALGDTHGSAFGGFYLPAMDALWKIGPDAAVAVRAAAADPAEIVAANAAGILDAWEKM